MNASAFSINGTTVRKNDTYTVIDNTTLPNLTLSKTILHPGKKTTGHKHDGLDEIYFFLSGSGSIKICNEITAVVSGDIIFIKGGDFHQVINPNDSDLEFNCVFQQYRR